MPYAMRHRIRRLRRVLLVMELSRDDAPLGTSPFQPAGDHQRYE